MNTSSWQNMCDGQVALVCSSAAAHLFVCWAFAMGSHSNSTFCLSVKWIKWSLCFLWLNQHKAVNRSHLLISLWSNFSKDLIFILKGTIADWGIIWVSWGVFSDKDRKLKLLIFHSSTKPCSQTCGLNRA